MTHRSVSVYSSAPSQIIILQMQTTDHRRRDDPRTAVGVSGAMQETAGYRGDYWTVVGRRDRLCH